MNTKSSPDIRILTVQEVADLLRVHRSTVSRFVKSGELKSYALGSRKMFLEADVLLFFENRVAPGYVSGKE